MKKAIKGLLILLITGYIILYFSYRNGYYIKKNEENTILTEEKIKEYENDLKNGVDVSSKSYVVIGNSYDNTYSRIMLRISNKIEKGIDKTIKFIFRRISKTINE